MKAENIESASLWTKAPVANLVRYEPSGIYFTRATVRGKFVRKTLDWCHQPRKYRSRDRVSAT